jgi:hypothetical protein
VQGGKAFEEYVKIKTYPGKKIVYEIYALLKHIQIFAVIIFLGEYYYGFEWMKKQIGPIKLSIKSFTMKVIISSYKFFTSPG